MTSKQYMTLCNLIEALWLKRKDADYYDIDFNNLPAQTSPQARKIATFIGEVLGTQKQKTMLQLAEEALTKTAKPLHYTNIWKKIESMGYVSPRGGKTPWATLQVVMSKSPKFVMIGSGMYGLNPKLFKNWMKFKGDKK